MSTSNFVKFVESRCPYQPLGAGGKPKSRSLMLRHLRKRGKHHRRWECGWDAFFVRKSQDKVLTHLTILRETRRRESGLRYSTSPSCLHPRMPPSLTCLGSSLLLLAGSEPWSNGLG